MEWFRRRVAWRAIGFVVFLIPYGMGGLGGGDVKLMAGFGALTGLAGRLPALLLVAVAGAATAIVFLVWTRLRGQAVPASNSLRPGHRGREHCSVRIQSDRSKMMFSRFLVVGLASLALACGIALVFYKLLGISGQPERR